MKTSLFSVATALILLVGCASLQTRKVASSDESCSFSNLSYSFEGTLSHVQGSDTIALFVHGSGTLDRDETFPKETCLDRNQCKFFKPLSDELNGNGVSTFRYDKRAFREQGTSAYESAVKLADYTTLKSDAWAAVEYVRSLGRYQKLILVGHSEGTAIVSELSMDHPKDTFISSIALIGVLATGLKEALRGQMTSSLADNTFKLADKNHDGKIFEDEVPPEMKPSLPFSLIDRDHKGYITRDDLMRVFTSQFESFLKAVQADEKNSLFLGKPSNWWQQHFARTPLLERAQEYSVPFHIFHGNLDQNVPFLENAQALANRLRSLNKRFTLNAFPLYGQSLSPYFENGTPSLGPVQADALGEFAAALVRR